MIRHNLAADGAAVQPAVTAGWQYGKSSGVQAYGTVFAGKKVCF